MAHPLLYEVNTRCWLRELAERCGTPLNLGTVPDSELAAWAERLPRGLERAALSAAHRLQGVRARLAPALLDRQFERAAAQEARAASALSAAALARLALAARAWGRAADPLRPALLTQSVRRAAAALDAATRQLAILSPLATLARGYAVVERPGGGVIATAALAAAAPLLSIRFADGRIEAEPRRVSPARPVQERLL